MKIKTNELMSFIKETVMATIAENGLTEKAPPGDEDKVMALKKSLRKQHPEWKHDKVVAVAMATAWKQHNEKKAVDEAPLPMSTAPKSATPQGPAAKPVSPAINVPAPKPVSTQTKDPKVIGKNVLSNILNGQVDVMHLDPESKKSLADFAKTLGITINENKHPTKITISELKSLIRNGLAEAFGATDEEVKGGTFGDGKCEKKVEKISLKDLKEEIHKVIENMSMDELTSNVSDETDTSEAGTYEASVPMVELHEGLWGFKVINLQTKQTLSIKEEASFPGLAKMFGWKGTVLAEAEQFLMEAAGKKVKDPGFFKKFKKKAKKEDEKEDKEADKEEGKDSKKTFPFKKKASKDKK